LVDRQANKTGASILCFDEIQVPKFWSVKIEAFLVFAFFLSWPDRGLAFPSM
jgi:hypothetical protein